MSNSTFCLSPESYNSVFPSKKERLIGGSVSGSSISSFLLSSSTSLPPDNNRSCVSSSSQIDPSQSHLRNSFSMAASTSMSESSSSTAAVVVESAQEPVTEKSRKSSVHSTSKMMTVDTEKLRHALRLVHCIQKERGSSCAYYANHALFETAMHEARTASDVSAKLMRPYTDLPIASSLVKIRSLILENSHDDDKHQNYPQTTPSNDLIFHRIFVCFNTLISSVVHECVLKDLSADKINESGKDRNFISSNGNKLQAQNAFNDDKKDQKRSLHSRHLSSDINDHLSSNNWANMGTPERMSNFRNTFAFNNDGAVGENNDTDPPPEIPSLNLSGPSSSSTTDPKNIDDGNRQVRQLLSLLKLFVQLKESAGVERAILSSLLAFRNCSQLDDKDGEDIGHRSLPSFRMLTNDLILEVENQRALYAKLKKLPSGPHHSLVLDLAELSPRLKDLQQIILTDFDSLKGAEFDSENIWNMITMYIDKLHSVELLIIEDLDLARADTSNVPSKHVSSYTLRPKKDRHQPLSDDIVDRALEQISGTGTGGVNHELLTEIKQMSPEELKMKVLGLLSGTFSQENSAAPTSRNTSRSVSIYAESAAAEILKQDMNDALHKPLERAASKEWEISIYEIKFTKRLGQGASATTYLGKWTGQNVAVKVASITDFGLEGWRTEVNALQRLHHPNIIRLMGSIYNENPQTHCLVLEYCNAGDLASALRYPTPRNFFFHVSSSIANAMSYLHQRGIIHRDLKPANVLCDGSISSGNFVVKITDFGIATDISRIYPTGHNADGDRLQKLTGETGTYRWMSPEVIRHEHYSTKADVYSFAVMLWQFVTHEEPFVDVSSVEAAKLVAVEKKRMAMPREIPSPLAEAIETNWDDNPDKRMGFSEIVETIQKLEDTLSHEDLVWLEEPYGHPLENESAADGVDAHLQEVFDAQPLPVDIPKRGEKGTSLGKKLRRSSPGHRGKSPAGRKPSLLSSFFRKHSFDNGKM